MQALWMLLRMFVRILLLFCQVPWHLLVHISEQVRQGRLAHFLRCCERLNSLHIALMTFKLTRPAALSFQIPA